MPGWRGVFVAAGLEPLLEDREQLKNACEVVPATGSRLCQAALVTAIACLGNIKDEPHDQPQSPDRTALCVGYAPYQRRLRIWRPGQHPGFP
jgi:hypothetical protein